MWLFITGIYYPPDGYLITTYREYIESLPYNDEPEIFGMHENANIAFQASTSVLSIIITTYTLSCRHKKPFL